MQILNWFAFLDDILDLEENSKSLTSTNLDNTQVTCRWYDTGKSENVVNFSPDDLINQNN